MTFEHMTKVIIHLRPIFMFPKQRMNLHRLEVSSGASCAISSAVDFNPDLLFTLKHYQDQRLQSINADLLTAYFDW